MYRGRIRVSRFACSCKLPLLLIVLLLLVSGCRRDMQDQPKMKPFRGHDVFCRWAISSTANPGDGCRVASCATDTEFFTGKKSRTVAGPRTQSIQGQAESGAGTAVRRHRQLVS